MSDAAAVVNVPALHGRHVSRAPTGAKEPSGHGTSVALPGHEKPATHGAHAAEPRSGDGAYVRGGHGVQVPGAVAPSAALLEPSAHATQSAADVVHEGFGQLASR